MERENRELRQANEILRKASAYFAQAELDRRVEAMIAFIDDHRGAYGVEPICKVLPIAPSTYHAHAAQRIDPAAFGTGAAGRCTEDRDPARVRGELRRLRRAQGLAAVAARGLDGRPLHGRAADGGLGLQGVIRGKPVRTTVSDKAAPARSTT